MTILILILIVILVLVILNILQLKKLKVPNVFLVTGGVKTGKSFVNVWVAIRLYKRMLSKYYFKKAIFRKRYIERPMLYSNIPLFNIEYNDLTLDIIERKVRIPNKSIVFIDEASLIADSMSFNDKVLNEKVQLFVKLFGHETHGGYLVYNTQDLKDLHFGFKRCTSNILYVHSKYKLPFFTIVKVREMISLNDDNVNTSNTFSADITESLKTIFIPNSYFKKYDCYAFSYLTDKLPLYVNYDPIILKSRIKPNKVISFKKFYTINKEVDTVDRQ